MPRLKSSSASNHALIGTSLFFLSCLLIGRQILVWWLGGESSLDGRNGDHFYYVAYAHMMNGHGYRDALEMSASFFSYERPSVHLDYEWMDVAIAPLLYSRTVLSAFLALAMRVFGDQGVWIPTIVMGSITHFMWWRLLSRSISRVHAGMVMLVLAMTPVLTEVRFGLYTESPLILLLTVYVLLCLRCLERLTLLRFISLQILLVLIAFTRQALWIPIAFSVGLFIHALFRQKSRFRQYLCTLTLILGWSLFLHFAVRKWAPYDPTTYAFEQNKVAGMEELIRTTAANIFRIFRGDIGQVMSYGRVGGILLVASLASVPWLMVVMRGHPLASGALGVLAVSTATTVLNGRSTGFRYMTPVIVVGLFLASLRPRRDRQTSSPELSSRDGREGVLLVGLLVILGVVGVSTCRVAFSKDEVKTWSRIEESTFPSTWPLVEDEGEIGCAGDDFQVWFKSSDGEVYAVSGPALQRRFFLKSVDEISAFPRVTLVSPTHELLRFGMTLCGAVYMEK